VLDLTLGNFVHVQEVSALPGTREVPPFHRGCPLPMHVKLKPDGEYFYSPDVGDSTSNVQLIK
jgi:hypothetical protein